MNVAITIGIRVLEVLFFAGWIGSILVISISLIDYIVTFMKEGDRIPQSPPVSPEHMVP